VNRRDVLVGAAASTLVAVLPIAATAAPDVWHVYRITDYEWYMGRTLAEAEAAAFADWGTDRAGAIAEYGYEPEDAYELDADAMERHRMIDSDEYENATGDSYPFRIALKRRIAEGPRAELFACTDW
jgi:hypothetical protein